MKPCFALCALLLLSACIYVDDIGAYWAKGIVDEALTGTWQEQKADFPEIREVTLASGKYRIEALDDKSKNVKDYQPLLARTLTLGNYTFFMTDPATPGAKPGSNSSNLWRYTLKAGRLTLYSLRPENFGKWLDKHYPYPEGKHITVDGAKAKKNGLYVNIAQLDDKVAGILADIPDGQTYWAKDKMYLLTKPKP